MRWFARRLLFYVFAIWVALTVNFLLPRLMPGDPLGGLLAHLSQPSSIEKLVVASGGYDLPAYEKFATLKVWAEAEPPKGTLYHYPNPHNHQTLSVAAAPSPARTRRSSVPRATGTAGARGRP